MDRENLWSRRSNTGKPSLSTRTSDYRSSRGEGETSQFSSKRYVSADSSSKGRSNVLNGVAPLNTNTVTSPGASSAFGLGSGAFASFGASAKTPKTPGGAFEFIKPSSASPPVEPEKPTRSTSKATSSSQQDDSTASAGSKDQKQECQLKYTWVMWYRPPASKNVDYEKSIRPMYKMSRVQDFWKIYIHLKRPSTLPVVSDYHFFKDGIRPVWEDDENKKGGKWIMRLKKGVIDRYWDDMLLAVIGDQFAEAGEEVCGMVVSVRNGEDVLSIWTKNDGGRNVKIRETIKRVLNLPPDTIIVWKSHDDSIAQRSAIDQARQEKGGSEKRHNTLSENPTSSRDKTVAS